MSNNVSTYLGLGFSIERMKPDEDYECEFHNLNEDETIVIDCPEKPVIAFYGDDQDSVCMCAKHFELFAFDLVYGLFVMAEAVDVDLPDGRPEALRHKDGSVLTKNAFTEIFCRVKKQKQNAGGNT